MAIICQNVEKNIYNIVAALFFKQLKVLGMVHPYTYPVTWTTLPTFVKWVQSCSKLIFSKFCKTNTENMILLQLRGFILNNIICNINFETRT